jgi:hypothetical protein
MLHRRMHDEGNLDEDLARDIGFALWRSPFRMKRGQGIDVCGLVARYVVEHLKRCGWRFYHPSAAPGPSAQETRVKR